MSSDELRRHLPLNPRVFALLFALLEGPTHGYRLKQAVEERSDGAITIDPGSLYRTIAKLVDEGIIEEASPPQEEAGGDARRRYYALTGLGRRLVAEEASRLRHLIEHGEQAKLLPES